jgi:glucosamine--fructose-6-phosphate aminotransferase (isomerizing)
LSPEVPRATSPTLMFREASEAPAVVRAQLEANAPLVLALAERLRRSPPRAVLTYGRGSSDHAATYARYLMETRLGVITASAPPSISSVYDAAPDMDGTLCLVISQSGRSPDLLAAAHAAAEAGALVVAIVNDEASPLARMAEAVLPLRAGPELSVAATKSFIATLAAILQLTAHWSQDRDLIVATETLPELLESAWRLDWSPALEPLARAQSLYVLGRGIGFGVAEEAALKLKETCGLHAEAFSSAELRHGPMALVGPGFPVLAFAQADETLEGVEAAARACAAQGAPVFLAGATGGAGVEHLPALSGHPALQTIAEAQSFYRFAETLARARGLDPDHPPHLSKVTETV